MRLDFETKKLETGVTLDALVMVYEAALRLLSPFMPFLTEEIWHGLYAALGQEAPAKSIALTRYPVATDYVQDERAEGDMELMQELIVAVRGVRKDIGVPEKEAAPVLVFGEVAVLAREHAGMLAKMARVSRVEVSAVPLSGAGVKSAARFDVQVVYERVVDVAAERERLGKELAKYEKGLAAAEKQLGNEGFLSRAPGHIVEGLKKQEAEMRGLAEKARAALAGLEKM